jgi:hypothetical protein
MTLFIRRNLIYNNYINVINNLFNESGIYSINKLRKR